MTQNIYNKVWDLHIALYNLRDTLNRIQDPLADNLIQPIKSLWFYSLLSPSKILTVVGPQGVGKSSMINSLLELNENECLPVGEGRCEQIPIILMNKTDYNNNETEVYKWSQGKENLVGYDTDTKKKYILPAKFFEIESLSYDEARKRALSPKSDDAVIFWYIKDNSYLNRIAPIAILPGFEIDAPWQEAIKIILELSDIIIYTIDFKRKAQASADMLEKWIQEKKVSNNSVLVVFTKSDMMDEQQKRSIEEIIKPYNCIFVGTGKNKKEQYDTLWKEISEKIVNLPSETQAYRLKIQLNQIIDILNKAEKIVKEKDAYITIGTSASLDSLLKDWDEKWNSEIRNVILNRIENIMATRVDHALETSRRIAEKEFEGFGNKIKLWFTGGPSVKKIVEIENSIRKSVLGGLNNLIVKELTDALKEKEEKIRDTDYVSTAMIILVTTPIKQIEHKMENFIQSLVDAGKVNKEMVNYLNDRIKDTETITSAIKSLTTAIDSPGTNRDVVSSTILSAAGTATAAYSAAEAAGGIALTGTAASVAGAIAGAVATIIAGLAITATILRSTRKMEWEVENYAREYTGEAIRLFQNNFKLRLDRFWEVFKYRMKENLRERMGLQDEVKNIINLYETLKIAKDTVYQIKKDLLI